MHMSIGPHEGQRKLWPTQLKWVLGILRSSAWVVLTPNCGAIPPHSLHWNFNMTEKKMTTFSSGVNFNFMSYLTDSKWNFFVARIKDKDFLLLSLWFHLNMETILMRERRFLNTWSLLTCLHQFWTVLSGQGHSSAAIKACTAPFLSLHPVCSRLRFSITPSCRLLPSLLFWNLLRFWFSATARGYLL